MGKKSDVGVQGPAMDYLQALPTRLSLAFHLSVIPRLFPHVVSDFLENTYPLPTACLVA